MIHTDSSDYAVGAALLQEFAGELHPVAFHSRKNNSAECNYPIHEKELLAIHNCIRTWSHYIGGTSAVVHTDHRSLQNFFTQPKLSGRQARWLETLQSHSVKFLYIEGEKNVVADALSHRPDHLAMNSLALSEVASPVLVSELQQAALTDAAYQDLIVRIQGGAIRGKQVVDGWSRAEF